MKICKNEMIVLSCGPGSLQLPSKVCILPANHPGYHSDGSAVWFNHSAHMQDLETRNDRQEPA